MTDKLEQTFILFTTEHNQSDHDIVVKCVLLNQGLIGKNVFDYSSDWSVRLKILSYTQYSYWL